MQGRIVVFLIGVLSGSLMATSSAARQISFDECLPFFDYSKDKVVTKVVQSDGSFQNRQVDITPEPIADSRFGSEVLRACGQFGSKVKPQAVQKLVEIFNPDLIKELAREFPDYSNRELMEIIGKAWTGSGGFEHVFCGQPKKDKVGGLHYTGRYFELQEKGQLCRITNNLNNEEILPESVYTIGISIPGGIVDRKKGFSIRQAAEDIFFEAARNYLRNCVSPSKNRRVCFSRFYQDGSFGNLFVCAPNVGIVTFYPLARVPKDTAECK